MSDLQTGAGDFTASWLGSNEPSIEPEQSEAIMPAAERTRSRNITAQHSTGLSPSTQVYLQACCDFRLRLQDRVK